MRKLHKRWKIYRRDNVSKCIHIYEIRCVYGIIGTYIHTEPVNRVIPLKYIIMFRTILTVVT